jgi:hypothetical protein
VVPRPGGIEPRYVVWTGADGTPHVQPANSFGILRGAVCARIARGTGADPDARRLLRLCAAPPVTRPFAPPAIPRRDHGRRAPVPAPLLLACASAVPVPPPILIRPGRSG